MMPTRAASFLDRPVDSNVDHLLGAPDAALTLVEYGSYACPYCRAANDEIAHVRDQLGDRLRYVFRHRPLTGSDLARRAAELVELAGSADEFWLAHEALMSRSAELTEDDLLAVEALIARQDGERAPTPEERARAKARVDADIGSARASGVALTPTFFINARRYDGPWDRSTLVDAMLGRLGHRVHAAAIDFASWGSSAGVLLLIATILALAIQNSQLGPGFQALLETGVGVSVAGAAFELSLVEWINDGLLTIFFLVVGLEIKREMTVGRLANRQGAALPIAGAIGGMMAPALVFSFIVPPGSWSAGWGVPMATDTAFAVAIIVAMGHRVPIELRVFLTAAAIVDDIGAIAVVALYYSTDIEPVYFAAAAGIGVGLWGLNRAHVYLVSPYLLLGVLLWAAVDAAGLHPTLAGVILALSIPTRPPANLRALTAQADTIIAAEAQRGDVLRHGPSLPALRTLDAIHARIESPADRLLRHAGTRSSYLVLPLFALANAGVALNPGVLQGHETLVLAIVAGLVLGKPAGIVFACFLATRLGLAVKPAAYSWRQLVGAGALAGIGFTMSLFIAQEAFPNAADFAAAKIAVLLGSTLAAIAGTALIFTASSRSTEGGGEHPAPDRDGCPSIDPVAAPAFKNASAMRRQG